MPKTPPNLCSPRHSPLKPPLLQQGGLVEDDHMIGLLSLSAEPPPLRPPLAAQLTAESDNGFNRLAAICSVELRSVAEDHG